MRQRLVALACAAMTTMLACGLESRTSPRLERIGEASEALLWVQGTTLLPSFGPSEDPDQNRFGWSVALNGNTALIGANRRNVPGCHSKSPNNGAGAAFTFVLESDAWQSEDILTASTGGNGDQFGQAVALSGDWAFVGAPCYEDGPTNLDDGVGEVYVFARVGSSWNELEALATKADAAPSADLADGDRFGAAVAVDGDRAAVGAPGRSSVFVFERDGLTWTLETELTSTSPGFGTSLSLAGDTLLVGSSGNRAFVYVHDGGWTLQSALPPSGQSTGSYGQSVDLDADGGAAIVGAQNQGATGAAYVYRRTPSGTWLEEQKLGPVGSGFGEFGWRVALDGSVAVVADRRYPIDNPSAQYQGAALTFERFGDCGATWCDGTKLITPDGQANDHFGHDISLQGGQLLVGVARDNLIGESGGSALVLTSVAVAGEPCDGPTDCAQSFCVDGVCCNQACGGPCRACDLPGLAGVCSFLAAGEVGACPDGQACNGSGQCQTVNGEGCVPSECLSQFCEDELCCDRECDEPCARCNLPGLEGTCTPSPAGEPPQADACAGYLCDGMGLGCPESCNPSSSADACAPGYECNAETATCEQGSACGDCGAYRCIDGACAIPCGSSADCLEGFQCNSDRQCVPAGDHARSAGCSVEPASPAGRGGWLVALVALGWVGRRRAPFPRVSRREADETSSCGSTSRRRRPAAVSVVPRRAGVSSERDTG